MSDENENPRLEVNQSQLAEIFDCVPRYIRTLEDEAVIERISGRSEVLYDATESARRYIVHLRNRKSAGTQEATDYNAARARKMAADADRAEIAVSLLAGKAHFEENLIEVWGKLFAAYRDKTLAIPHKCTGLVLGRSNFAEVNEILEQQVREALNELSEIDPANIPGTLSNEERDELQAATDGTSTDEGDAEEFEDEED